MRIGLALLPALAVAAACSSVASNETQGDANTEIFDSGSVLDASPAATNERSTPDGSDDGSVSLVPGTITTTPPPTNAACLQTRADSSSAPSTAHYIYPRQPVTPFYQWENDNGYCGEVSMIQAGMNNGQWMSQLNARLVCGAAGNGVDAPQGTSLSQAGPDGFCAANGNTPDYNAQFLIENAAAANAASCLSNARLAYQTYDYTTSNVGQAGYQNYMSWVKAQTIAGNQVTIGVLIQGGSDPQYDHIVSVMAIGTNHDPTDVSYYDDDVVYFDDHGAYTSTDANPSVPPGTGGQRGCTPYVFGYTFGSLPASRSAANQGSNEYAILLPGVADTQSYVGGNGVNVGPDVTGHDYAFSVLGPADSDGSTMPVTVSLAATTTSGVANAPDPLAGYNYENPYIGNDDQGNACTNTAPPAMGISLLVTVRGLTTGASYNLYEYDFDSVSGTGTAAALAVPTSAFNAHASMAAAVTSIVATGPTFTETVTKTAFQTVVFRAVPASAP